MPATATAPQNEKTLQWSDVVVFPVYVSKPAWKPKINTQDQLSEYIRCSCVNFVKEALGITGETWGYPNRLAVISDEPQVGWILLTTEGDWGHVALVTSVSPETIVVTESNYYHCSISTRSIPRSAPFIRGYRR